MATNKFDMIDASVKKMMSDGKIDLTDIPEMVLLVTKLSASEIIPRTTEEFGAQIDELYVFIMNKYSLFPKNREERQLFDKMFKSSVKLILYQPILRSKCDSFWGGLCR